MSLVEKDGYRVNGFVADSTLEADFRSYKESYIAPEANGDLAMLAGRPVAFDNSGYFDLDTALLVGGDFSKAVYAIRQDITYKVLTEALIQNTDGTTAYNLAQQDMVALRVVMRLGVQVAVPATRRKGVSGYPFAVLAPAA
jgi:HK97 family phage major capsid protein